MKSRHYLFILAVAAMAGCQNEKFQLQNNAASGLQFTGTTESYAPETRTAIDADMNVVWKQGDQLSIFVGKTLNQQFQVQNSCDGKIDGAFDPVSTPGFVSSTAIQNNVGYYPYSSATTLQQDGQNYILSTTLPAQQTYAANSFGSGAFPMVAVTEDTYDTNLKFKNVLGGIKLQLKGTAKIKSIKISGNNNEILCGPATVTAAYGSLPNIEMSPEGGKEVTLDCGTGVQLNSETATNFIIALPNLTFTKGFTVTITDTDDKAMTVSTNKERTVNRSTTTKMAAINYVGEKVQKPLTFTSTGTTTIALDKVGKPYAITLEYKLNDGAWTSYSIGTAISLTDKEQVSFQAGESGNSKFSKYNDDCYTFKMSGSGTIAASGNIMSLVCQDMKSLVIPYEDYFHKLFDGCTALTTTPELPATTLADGCYSQMFRDCSALTTAPILPATTLASDCYGYMFSGCTSLTSSPDLPATILPGNCYSYMFSNCTSLHTAPELPATTLGDGCYYYMFSGCTSLTTAPELPATTLTWHCYYHMFSGCVSLTTVPKLLATTLSQGCYGGMYSGCTSLTTAPVLPATTLTDGCYCWMFYGCTKLNYVKALFTTTPSNTYTQGWLYGVSSTGTFVKSKDATWNVTGTNGIPSGWIADIDGVTRNGYEYVDLGLSVKWATMNVGATKSTDYGDYFAWGETSPKSTYNWSTYKYCKGNYDTLTKYCYNSSYGYNGFTDSKTVLDAEDDAASVNWGGSWRMPTIDEWDELRDTDNCTWTWYSSGNTEFNGVAGFKVVSKISSYEGNFIFLPNTGYIGGIDRYHVSSYWSSSLNATSTYCARYLSFDSAHYGTNFFRYCGESVRPVCH